MTSLVTRRLVAASSVAMLIAASAATVTQAQAIATPQAAMHVVTECTQPWVTFYASGTGFVAGQQYTLGVENRSQYDAFGTATSNGVLRLASQIVPLAGQHALRLEIRNPQQPADPPILSRSVSIVGGCHKTATAHRICGTSKVKGAVTEEGAPMQPLTLRYGGQPIAHATSGRFTGRAQLSFTGVAVPRGQHSFAARLTTPQAWGQLSMRVVFTIAAPCV